MSLTVECPLTRDEVRTAIKAVHAEKHLSVEVYASRSNPGTWSVRVYDRAGSRIAEYRGIPMVAGGLE